MCTQSTAAADAVLAECSAVLETATLRAKEAKDTRDEAVSGAKEAQRILKEPPVSVRGVAVCVWVVG